MVAEACGNRTHLARVRRHTGFEDQEGHQAQSASVETDQSGLSHCVLHVATPGTYPFVVSPSTPLGRGPSTVWAEPFDSAQDRRVEARTAQDRPVEPRMEGSPFDGLRANGFVNVSLKHRTRPGTTATASGLPTNGYLPPATLATAPVSPAACEFVTARRMRMSVGVTSLP